MGPFILLGFLAIFTGFSFSLEILNTSPIISNRLVIFSLSTQLEGTVDSVCYRSNGESLPFYITGVPIELTRRGKADPQYLVHYGIFQESDNVTCTVTSAQDKESQITEVLVVPPSTKATRHRKEIRSLTEEDKNAYMDAILELKRIGVYDFFVGIHDAATSTPARNAGEEDCEGSQFPRSSMEPCTNSQRNMGHNGPLFLPWHREFVTNFEDALIMVNREDPSIAGHYWNWVLDHEAGYDSPIFTAQYYGACDPEELESGGRSGALLVDGPFTPDEFPVYFVKKHKSYVDGVRRSPGSSQSSLPSSDNLKFILCMQGDYDVDPWATGTGTFRDSTEGSSNQNGAGGFHNTVHGWVGGHFVDVSTSPNDPLFFAHHINLDRVFYGWQLRNPDKIYLPRDEDPTAPPLHAASAQLWPLGSSADEVWEITEFTYDISDFEDIICD